MQLFAYLFVGKPLNILAVGIIFLAVFVVLHSKTQWRNRRHRQVLAATLGWGFYAAWEWLVQFWTPEANIRADLLIILPIVAIVSLWAVFYLLRLIFQLSNKSE